MLLPRFSVGVGDRFAREGQAQLAAFVQAKAQGVTIAPVWNKSFREHSTIHSEPMSTRVEADAAVKALGWTDGYFVDADHIGQKTVDGFLAAADFYTLDVADFIGKPSADAEIQAFVAKHTPASGVLAIPGIAPAFTVAKDQVEAIARKYLFAVKEAHRIYRRIEAAKGKGTFVTEVSMDETDKPQTPLDLWFILAALADEGTPVQTIAPKFSGRFNKGVDFVGDVAVFEKEFNEDLLVIAHAVKLFGFPANLKLSVHSGSDKFSVYGVIRRALERHNAGLHLKTCGTTWLEEVAGLAEASPEGLSMVKQMYVTALARYDELAAPYATVIDIDVTKLPSPAQIEGWTSRQFVDAVTHDQQNPGFNPALRQLFHIGYKVAAELGPRYVDALEAHRVAIGRRVTGNLFHNHLVPLFVGRP